MHSEMCPRSSRINDLGSGGEEHLVTVVGGLCDAVTTTPAAASSPVIDHARTGVGWTPGWIIERTPTQPHAGRVDREDLALAAGVVGDRHTAS